MSSPAATLILGTELSGTQNEYTFELLEQGETNVIDEIVVDDVARYYEDNGALTRLTWVGVHPTFENSSGLTKTVDRIRVSVTLATVKRVLSTIVLLSPVELLDTQTFQPGLMDIIITDSPSL